MLSRKLTAAIPILHWLPRYRLQWLADDSLAGLIVAIMLVPQGMAYALLAGLPPEMGLYASMVPLFFYGILGSSRTLAVGPVAIVSLMVASTLGDIFPGDVTGYIAGATLLAFISGALLLIMGLARLGFLINFLSHPVISGFSSAAALVIGFSQLKHLLGLNMPRTHLISESISHAMQQLSQTNVVTLLIGIASLITLVLWRSKLPQWLASRGLPSTILDPLSKAGPLVVVTIATVLVWVLRLDESNAVNVVATVPAGLPQLQMPDFDAALISKLLPPALLISAVGFLESVSVAKSLASKKRQKIDPDQELIALGAANLGASIGGGFPVTGGFSRSLVNFTSGAVTPLASIITAVLVALTALYLTPLLYFLPQATLAAIIIVAVSSLIDTHTLHEAWRYNKPDAISLLATFFSVLAFGIEIGIIAGVTLSIALYLWRTSRPHIAMVGRVGNTEHFRNVQRHKVQTHPEILTVRVDESLYFANSAYLESRLLADIADQPLVDHLVLVMSAVNFIDASALDTLEKLAERLHDSGVTLHFSEVKGPVMDRLRLVDFEKKLKQGKIYLSTYEAMTDLAPQAG